MSITSVLNVAKNALSASQMAVQVTSNNIANVDTKGYARQEAVMEERIPSITEGLLIGNGVRVSSVIRYYDKYLDQQVARKNTELSEQNVYKNYFGRIESLLNEDNNHLTQTITDFFNGWQDLSTDPQSVPNRMGLVSKGQNLTRTINSIYNELKSLQTEQNNNVKMGISDINRITASIASLNGKILEGSSGSSEANDYLSQRTELLKELSGEIGITALEDSYGRITILTASGKPLIDGTQSWNLVAINDPTTGFSRVGWKDSSKDVYDITDNLGGGNLQGLITMRDEKINDFIDNMDTLAQTLITEVNNVHMAGYTLNHSSANPNPDNIPFFKQILGNYSGSIALSDQVKADSKNIAASSEIDAATGKPIGNGVALDIAALIDKAMFDGNTTTVADYTSSITNKIGQLSKGAQASAQFSQDTMATMEKQRESVSGVSLDEEMANLMKYQYAYQAASRLYTIADQLFQSLLQVAQ
jgi:flagellar hook-associated protein 1 FlgK